MKIMWNSKRKSPAVETRLTEPLWPAQLQALKERLATTEPTDALLAGVFGWLDANLRTELDPATTAGLTNEEAHRFRGRIGMLLDLKQDLARLHLECREMKSET